MLEISTYINNTAMDMVQNAENAVVNFCNVGTCAPEIRTHTNNTALNMVLNADDTVAGLLKHGYKHKTYYKHTYEQHSSTCQECSYQ